jgi:D-hexose-6-phosphate mutarotase
MARDANRAGASTRLAGTIAFPIGQNLHFDVAPNVATIVDPGLRRRIAVTRTAGRSAIVWHPGPGVRQFADVPPDLAYTFVCVESGDVGASAATLPPGATHRIAATYAVEALA